jgi:hypothetical protein
MNQDLESSAVPAGTIVVGLDTATDGALWFRTQPASALGRQYAGGRVVVEVDHVDRDAHTAWSVLVAGTAEPVDVADVMQMRVWPVGSPGMFVRVEPAEVSGRRLSAAT